MVMACDLYLDIPFKQQKYDHPNDTSGEGSIEGMEPELISLRAWVREIDSAYMCYRLRRRVFWGVVSGSYSCIRPLGFSTGHGWNGTEWHLGHDKELLQGQPWDNSGCQ